ncbi:MAG: Flp pilus assembly protein CpaB [Acidobacteria bacterium]|nr:Flp pilus assembly protein CpaB [Acidobacteriota bacterium]
MNRRFFIALAGAIVFGLLAILLAQRYMEQNLKQKIAQGERDVIVAVGDIPVGTEITTQQVKSAKFKADQIPPGAMLKLEEVLNRVTTADIPDKTFVLSKQLAGLGAQPGLSSLVTEGMRSVSVRVDEASGVAGFISPGTYVDVIAIMTPQLDGAKPVSKVVLQKVRVLAGGQKMETSKDGKPALVNTVTLELTPAQAEKVKLAESEGKLQLSIRNATDQDLPKTPGATKRDVLDDIALERRALEGVRQGAGGGPRPMPTIQPWTINVNNPNQQPQGPSVKKVNLEKTIELIEGTKRSRIEMVP